MGRLCGVWVCRVRLGLVWRRICRGLLVLAFLGRFRLLDVLIRLSLGMMLFVFLVLVLLVFGLLWRLRWRRRLGWWLVLWGCLGLRGRVCWLGLGRRLCGRCGRGCIVGRRW